MTPNETMQAFFTRERANEGISLPLAHPDGRDSKHWIKIRGVDSDAFKAAEAIQRRRIYEVSGEEDKSKLAAVLADIVLENTCALIISWSFDDPCTPENIKKLLTEAPQIRDQIDRIANRRSLFFKNGSTNSTPSPAPSSS